MSGNFPEFIFRIFHSILHSSHSRKQIFIITLVITTWLAAEQYQIVNQAQTGSGVSFVNVAPQRGIQINDLSWSIAWGDYNNDGYVDLYSNNHVSGPTLFRNNAGQSFADVTSTFNLIDSDLHGANWADFDNDGDVDLAQSVGGLNRPNFLYRNDDAQAMPNIADVSGVEDDGRGRGATWVDYDHDGDLDLFLTNIGTPVPSEMLRNNGDGTFTFRTSAVKLGGISAESQAWGDYNNDGWLDLIVWKRDSLELYRNQGDGTYTERTAILSGVNDDQVYDIDWVDYDNDGDLDLYLSRGVLVNGVAWTNNEIKWFAPAGSGTDYGFDFGIGSGDNAVTFRILDGCNPADRNRIYIGSGENHPPSATFTLQPGQASGKPGYNPGSDMGIFIWRDSGGWHVRSSLMRNSGVATISGNLSDVDPHQLVANPAPLPTANQLWENQGSETFVNVTQPSGTGTTQQSRASVWADFDNDGDLDIYVINHSHFLGNAANNYFQNNGNKTFTELTNSAGLGGSLNGVGDGAAVADYNRDGFLDIAISNGASGLGPCEGPLMLYENQRNGNHRLQIKTTGTVSNRDGIGAKIRIEADGKVQTRQQIGGQHGNVQNSQLLQFGLGGAIVIDSLTITWPSGIVDTHTNIAADQAIEVIEGEPGVTPYFPAPGLDLNQKYYLPVIQR